MKKTILILLSILCLVVIILLLARKLPFKKEPIYIALAGPMEHKEGKFILMGVNLYLDKVNSQGGIDGRKIELLIFDDKNDKGTAVKVASDIADQGKALLVLGHYYSSASIAAGKIYRKNQIPAITASATAESVTSENDWYFRVVPNNTIMSGFIANYVNRSLKKTSASILFANNSYSLSLANGFEKTAKKLGISIKKKWRFDKTSDKELKAFMKELEATDDPGMLFIPMYPNEAAKIVTLLKDKGKTYPIIGPDTFSSEIFLDELKKYPKEQTTPGYYSDGIYCTSFYMSNVGSKEAYFFEKEFLRTYNMKPSWESTCYYDAVHVAIEAIKKVGVRGQKHIRGDRRKIREVLTGFYSSKTGIRGITGDIYFDINGDAIRPCSIGFYENQKQVPSFLQYHQLTSSEGIDDIFKKALEGEVIVIYGKTMKSIWVIYSGVYVNEVNRLDVKNSSYSADFYLWFRFNEDFDDANIKFADSNPIKDQTNTVLNNSLGQPIWEGVENGIITRVYHIKADFKAEFDFHAYPFDQHSVNIHFYHANWIRDKLIYVPDSRGLPSAVQSANRKETVKIDAAPEWKIKDDMLFFETVISKVSSLGHPKLFDLEYEIAYSQFNADIRFEREFQSIINIFLPVIGMAVILYLTYFISPARLRIRALIIMAVLVVNMAYHLKIVSDMPVEYLTAIEYALFTVYALSVISALMSVFIYNLHEKGDQRRIFFLIYGGKIIYPSLALTAGFLLVFTYYPN